MQTLFKKIIVILVISTMVVSCAGMKDSTRTKVEGTAAGAGIGALVGAGLGAVIGGKEGAAIGAGAGALLGGAVGYGAGTLIANKKEQYATEEERLEAEITIVAQHNRELDDYNEKMTAKINDMKKEILVLQSRYANDENRLAVMKTKQTEINKVIDETNTLMESKKNELTALNDYQQSLNNATNQPNIAKLKQEIETLKNNIDVLDKKNVQMAKLVQSLNVRK